MYCESIYKSEKSYKFDIKQGNIMNVKITGNSPLNYSCSNEQKKKIKLSGDKTTVSPMESVLMAAASCSSVDIELILKKMRQNLEKLEVEVDAERATTEPKVFTKIHLHYILKGKLKIDKVKEAVDMSVNKYCSVLTMLAKTAEIRTSFEIVEG
jgi:putative redox protein